MSRNTIASINLAAIRHNFKIVRKLAPASKIACVVKANAYGHGISRVADALRAADLLAVATVDEAAVLRSGGWTGRLLLLQGFANADDLQLAQSLQLEMVIHQQAQIDALWQRCEGADTRFWLKLESGMHRLGFPLSDAHAAYAALESISGAGSVILMTHFACADEPGKAMTQKQIQLFEEAVRGIEAQQSLANSAGIINFPQSHKDLVRPGLILYGISPDTTQPAASIGLKPAMTLSSELIAIKQCARGETVGYGASYACPEDMRIGVAAIGYGDGYPRSLRNGAPLLVNGKLACLAGRVSMDLITLDLRGHDEARIGDPVVLWGEGLAVESVAPWADAIAYELVCGVSIRVPRISI